MDSVKTIVCQSSPLYQGLRKVGEGRNKAQWFLIFLLHEVRTQNTFQNKCYPLFRDGTKIGTMYNQ